MTLKRESNIFLLFLEAIGIFTLFKLFSKIFMPILSSESVGNLFFWISFGVFGAISAYLIRKIKSKWTWKDIGFKVHRSWKKDIWFGVVIFSLFYIIMIPFSIALLPSSSKLLSQYYSFLQDMTIPMALLSLTPLVFIKGFITGAFHEEIRYRGYLQGLFYKNSYPALGFFISLILFSFHHYFSHPDWIFLKVLNTLPGGISFCLGYYATGSLIVPMTTHALMNVFPVYAPFVYSKGHSVLSYIIIFAFGIISLLIIIKGKEEVKYLLQKTKEIFTKSGWKMSLLGIILGILFLILLRELSLVQSQLKLDNSLYYLLLAIFPLICISISSIKFRKSIKNNMTEN